MPFYQQNRLVHKNYAGFKFIENLKFSLRRFKDMPYTPKKANHGYCRTIK